VGVWAFGSRASGRPRSNSGLDLLFDPPLLLAVQAKLAEAFEESALPFTVDLVNRAELADEYRASVDRAKIPLRR
jgi:predicted nucleotidyltransferase